MNPHTQPKCTAGSHLGPFIEEPAFRDYRGKFAELWNDKGTCGACMSTISREAVRGKVAA